MLAKNLPAGVETEELQRMFEKYGDCQKVLMPSGQFFFIYSKKNTVSKLNQFFKMN